MLYVKKSKRTQKHYLYYIDVYGSMAFPTKEILNNKTLEMFGGIDIQLPDESVRHLTSYTGIKVMLKLLDTQNEDMIEDKCDE